ncbi:GspH/FimT family pseudopilin [Pseudomonas jinjuensis]|uniref:Type II secretion system protein H n=1 Tax=Pseudomonas jinjuensis TaxID=198616 RepID=A0A1H0MJI1_9PSED|nr:GspH/FimT family pseudopilin [Pseudomonas jinjuensis]SDO80426.1 type IV fimbrial biogenesis protein FimT [Pseudomonas jinjuensis]
MTNLNERGFTIIELMVTLAVAAILLSIAVPNFSDMTLGSKLGASANSLVSGARVARSEAIKRNAVVSLCASSDGATCSSSADWEDGWIVLGGGTVVMAEKAAPSGLRILSEVKLLEFQPSGVGSTQAVLTVCRSTPNPGSQERVVTFSATGRASVTKTTTGSCS